MNRTKFSKEYTEVYEILNCLNEEEYSKIPEELLQVFEENRDLDYEYKVNEEQDLLSQPMLRGTKAILLNIFKDYLATPKQQQRIKEWLQNDRKYLESQKNKNYKVNLFESDDKAKKDFNVLPAKVEKTSIIKRIIDKLKKVFGNKGKL